VEKCNWATQRSDRRLRLSACGQVLSHITCHITSHSAARRRVMTSLSAIYGSVQTGRDVGAKRHDVIDKRYDDAICSHHRLTSLCARSSSSSSSTLSTSKGDSLCCSDCRCFCCDKRWGTPKLRVFFTSYDYTILYDTIR